MHLLTILPVAVLSLLSPVDFSAIDLTRYSDAPWDRATNVAVSFLTQEQVFEGNPVVEGGIATWKFSPEAPLNRAEFMQVAMRLLPASSKSDISSPCFPDVPRDAWYAEAVCRAKTLGIIQGNVVSEIPSSNWKFEPSRNVQYEEALKVLSHIFGIVVMKQAVGDWYVPFLQIAEERGLALAGFAPGAQLRRGEMARLTAAFLADDRGQLAAYRSAERGIVSSIASSSVSFASSKSVQRSSSVSSSTSSRSSAQMDSYGDTSIRAAVLMMGKVSPVLAAVNFFSDLEPIFGSEIRVTLTSPVSSIDSLLVFSGSGMLLGTATLHEGDATYALTLEDDAYTLQKRRDQTLYVRARLKDADGGGVSGETVQVANVQFVGTGEWTSGEYTTTSSDDFLSFQTAIGRIESITNAGGGEGVLVSGQQIVGEFSFNAVTSRSRTKVQVTDLTFTIGQTGGVTLQNPVLRVQGMSDGKACTVSGTKIVCSAIPASIGTLDGTVVLQIFADVTVPANATNALLQLTLNDPGDIGTAGDITWTDGESSFSWVPFTAPIARGTALRQ